MESLKADQKYTVEISREGINWKHLIPSLLFSFVNYWDRDFKNNYIHVIKTGNDRMVKSIDYSVYYQQAQAYKMSIEKELNELSVEGFEQKYLNNADTEDIYEEAKGINSALLALIIAILAIVIIFAIEYSLMKL